MTTSRRSLAHLAVLACALSALAGNASAALAGNASAALAGDASAAGPARPASLLERIRDYRQATWRWERVMGAPLTPTSHAAERSRSTAFRRRVLAHWKERAKSARRKAQNPPRLRAWLCIHRHEGPWNANTGNGYYGGLQMDLRFQRTYGAALLRRKGTANRWRPLEQIWVAERAYRSGRGFHPWPNAARACGLL